jgi:hypothetical protein
MEGFTFASVLDLSMGYYHIKLDADDQKLCTIVFPWNMGTWEHGNMGTWENINTNTYP